MAPEIRFEGFLPKVAHRISAAYRIRLGENKADAKVLVLFVDDFLGRCRVQPISTPDPVKFSPANEALLAKIGQLSIAIALNNKTPEELRQLGEHPLVVINGETTPEDSLEKVIDRLRQDAEKRPPIGFRKPQ